MMMIEADRDAKIPGKVPRVKDTTNDWQQSNMI